MARKIPSPGIADNDVRVKQRFVKGYLQVVQNLYNRNAFTAEQAKLAEQAYQRRLPPSGFVALIRSRDPQYVRSHDFRLRQGEAKETWNVLRPGRPMPQEFAAKYVHSGLNKGQLLQSAQKYLSSQQVPAFKPSQNMQAYAQMRALLNESFRKYTGSDAHPHLHDLVFSSRLQERHIDEQYHDLFGGRDVFKWLDPEAPTKEMKKAFTPPAPAAQMMATPNGFNEHLSNQLGIGVQNRK